MESGSDGLTVVPSTTMVIVPVGVVLMEATPDETEMAIVLVAPGTDVDAAADSVVMEETVETGGRRGEEPGHLVSRAYRSIDPRPEARSYPGPAA